MADQGQGWLQEAVEEAHRRFSGTYEYALDVLPDVPYPDAPWTEERPDQQDLAWMRRQLGGNDGYPTDPSGKEHFVSLARWRDDSPDTPCCFHWTFVPDPAVWEERKRFWADRYKDRHDELRCLAAGEVIRGGDPLDGHHLGSQELTERRSAHGQHGPWHASENLVPAAEPLVHDEIEAADSISTALELAIVVWSTLLLAPIFRWREPSRRVVLGAARVRVEGGDPLDDRRRFAEAGSAPVGHQS